MALNPSTKPTTPGTFNGEIRNGWSWVSAANMWLDFSGINIGNTNVVDNLTNAGVTSLNDTNGNPLGSTGLGLPDYSIKLDTLQEALANNPDKDPFNINTNVGFGNGPEIRLGDLDFDFPSGPIEIKPQNFSVSLIFTSNPNILFIISGGAALGEFTKGIKNYLTDDFISPRTFTANAGGFGLSSDTYIVQRRERTNNLGLPVYILEISKNGAFHASLDTSNRTSTLSFSFKEQVIEPKPIGGINVSVDLQSPSNTSLKVDVNNSTDTFYGDDNGGVSDNQATSGTITATPSGVDSTCNYLYELFNQAGGLIASSTQQGFSYNKLESGNYTLKATISKTVVPELPADTPSYKYTSERYYVTKEETRGTVASGPQSVVTKASLVGNNIVNFGTGAYSEQTIEINYSSTNADYVIYTLGNGKTQLNRSGTVSLSSSDLFNGAGKYTVYFQAVSNSDGSGNIVPITFIAIRKDILPGPDIQTVEYPQLIVGKDYQGYNVDFEISWTSVNTNYIDIYIGDIVDSKKIASKRPSDGVQSFNIADVLRKAGDTLNEDVDVATFNLKLIPYNEEGDSKTEGKVETIQIQFDKGNLKLRRDKVLRDIKEAICDLFDTSILGGDSSKYLTHLMHFGEADNKLIASWDTDYETFSEYEFREDTGERVKIHEEKTLVFKLYEPLPRNIQPNQQIWVSKIQSIPYVEQITLINEEVEDCVELSPNFGTGVCGGENIGYQLYDDLVASGSSSSTKLLTEYVSGSGFDLKKLDIHFVSSSQEVSGSILIDGESTWAWNNFVKYSSANERIDNFMYKIKLIEFHDDKIEKLESGSFHTGSITLQNEINRNSQSIQEIKDGFDAFESFLYTSSSIDGLTYPGAGGTNISASESSDVTTWYESISTSAQNYDYYNKDYLVNNLPLHVQNSEDSEQFKIFFNMMGHHFDVLYVYTKAIAEKKNLEHKYNIGIKDSLLSEMLKSLSWDTKIPAKAQSLWEYAFGETSDGTVVSSMSGKKMQNEIWRRLLNNLPYLLKHKGTSRAVKAALACYGVPSSMLTIMEFGGPRNADGGVTKFSFEDRTAALNISGSESVLLPWKEYSETNDFPNTVEIRVNSKEKQDQTFVSSSLWNVGVIHYSGNQAKLKLTVSDTTTSYFVTSSEFPFYNDEYTQVVVTKSGNSFNVYGKEAFQGRIRSEVSASLELEGHIWQTDTTLVLGGSTFTGSVDEFRYWSTALSESRIDNHTLMPDAIDGNHHSSSTEDLIFRLDFEYPKDRSSSGDIYIKNVSINEGYGESYATASGFVSISEYPYHYTTYERTVTANVPSSGFNVSQKFRFEEQQGLNEEIEDGLTLSYRERSTKKSFDTSPIDSNRLGLFFSPIKEINMDILKSIGQFELDDYIGDPSDEYRDEYRDLRVLRNYYFERYNLNLYEYIQLVRYIDQSLFEVLESLVPARAIVSSGLLIEPHILERNKVKRIKPLAVEYGSKFQDGKIDTREALQLAMIPIDQWPADLRLREQVRLAGLQSQYESLMKISNPTFVGNFQDLLGRLRDLSPTFVSTVDLIDGRITDSVIVDKLIRQFEAFGGQEQIGIDIDSLANGMAGITAVNGYAYITKLDGQGNLIKEHKQVFIVEESYTIQVPKLINPLDPSLGYEFETVTKIRKIVVFADIGDSGPQVGGNIISVTRANSNGGKLFGNTLGSSRMGEKYSGRGFRFASVQTEQTTLDRKSPVETFCTNPNILKVSDTQRGAGEPILEVDVK